jgi:predicted MPP superfamily phosphohydrolase
MYTVSSQRRLSIEHVAPHAVSGRGGGLTRRKLLFSLSAFGFGCGAYARFIEPQWLETTLHRIQLTASSLSQPIRILHLSDFHASSYVPMPFLEHAIELGLAWWPDLICLTGDFVTCSDYYDRSYYQQVLRRLSNAAPAFACLGNHDGGLWASHNSGSASAYEVVRLLENSGITVLQNASELVRFGGLQIQVIGLSDLWSKMIDPAQAYRRYKELPTIVLAHNPDWKDAIGGYPWDLQLSGHTHGGQVRLFFDGRIFVPVRDKRYVAGLGRWENRWIYVTRGVGNIRGMRFCCRPELSLLEIV